MDDMRKSLQNPPQSPWFDWIQGGVKRYEGRLFKGDWAALKTGDTIVFVCPLNRELSCTVVGLLRFSSFREAFEVLGSELVPIPGVNSEQVASIYREFYSDAEVEQYGVVAVKVDPKPL